jgi:hypothetical protein
VSRSRIRRRLPWLVGERQHRVVNALQPRVNIALRSLPN